MSSHKGEREAEEQASQKCFSPLLQSLALPWETSLTAQGGVLWDPREGGCVGRVCWWLRTLQTPDSEIRAPRLILWCFSHFQGWVALFCCWWPSVYCPVYRPMSHSTTALLYECFGNLIYTFLLGICLRVEVLSHRVCIVPGLEGTDEQLKWLSQFVHQ